LGIEEAIIREKNRENSEKGEFLPPWGVYLGNVPRQKLKGKSKKD
jgi:hypothetical protein